MYWLGFVALILVMAFLRYQSAKRQGLWSWPKFFFTIGFLLAMTVLVSAPVMLMNMKSPFFWPVYAAGWVVAAGLFVWFIIKARKWKFPDARTSPDADRNQRPPN